MKKITILSLILFHLGLALGQNIVTPIQGVYGADYIIVNYPDWHTTDGPVLIQDGVLNDYQCGTKTYDGHQGTDFVIRGFTQMDSGVNVLASADGEIIYVIDSLFDRETAGIDSLSLGNYIGIYHASTNTYSYYAHLKKNSVIVQVGDFVAAGQAIGQVGSSGNSTDPHLHYELWNPGLITDPTIDPWGMPCNLAPNLWQNPPPYDTSFAVWECGLVNYDSVNNFSPYTWNALRERLGQKQSFTVNDPFFTFWALQYGLKIGDQTRVEWYEPNGNLYDSETVNYSTQDWWFHYFNHAISTPPTSKYGLWTVKYYYNNQLATTKTFPYGILSYGSEEVEALHPYYFLLDDGGIEIVIGPSNTYTRLKLYNSTGEIVLEQNIRDESNVRLHLPENYATGYYIISLVGSKDPYRLKVIFD